MQHTTPLNIVALFYWEALDFDVYIKSFCMVINAAIYSCPRKRYNYGK